MGFQMQGDVPQELVLRSSYRLQEGSSPDRQRTWKLQ